MTLKNATVVSSAGLHARIVSMLADCVKDYAGTAEIIWGEKRTDIKKMLGLLAMAIPAGAVVTVMVNGPDEERMARALVNIVEETH
mgnify:CR=1 FL=1